MVLSSCFLKERREGGGETRGSGFLNDAGLHISTSTCELKSKQPGQVGCVNGRLATSKAFLETLGFSVFE